LTVLIDEFDYESEITPDGDEYIPNIVYRVEYLLKNHNTIRLNATRTLISTEHTAKSVEQDIIDTMSSGAQTLSADRVQTTLVPDNKMINMVDQLSERVAFTNESLKRRRDKAYRELAEIDALFECVERLNAKHQMIITTFYDTFEVTDNNGIEVYKPLSLEAASIMCGYSGYNNNVKFQKKKAIQNLTEIFQQRRYRR
jgi:hypothetical protein